MKDSNIGRKDQVIAGATLLVIAVTAGATGLTINVLHGLQVSVAAAVLFGLADLTKIVLPIVSGVIGWTRQAKLTAVVCIAVSLWCASNSYLERDSQRSAVQEHGASQYAMAQADVAKLETHVASLDAQAAKEAMNGGCGKQCRFLQERAQQARVELSGAKQRLSATQPVAVSGYQAIKADVTAGMFLFLIESLIWLTVPAMTLLRQALQKPVKPTVRKSRKVAKPRKAKKKDWTKVEAYSQPPRVTKSGKIDGRSKAARAVKRVTSAKLVAV